MIRCSSPTIPSQVHIARLNGAEDLNLNLLKAFERERDGFHVRRSHMFAGRFENTYIDLPYIPELRPLAEAALSCARELTDRTRLKWGYWFNEMAPGHVTTLHTHDDDDELLSGVYYLRVPPNSGRLIVHTPPAVTCIVPEAGMFVFFPPDAPHEVERNDGDGTRLSIAFNFGPED